METDIVSQKRKVTAKSLINGLSRDKIILITLKLKKVFVRPCCIHEYLLITFRDCARLELNSLLASLVQLEIRAFLATKCVNILARVKVVLFKL